MVCISRPYSKMGSPMLMTRLKTVLLWTDYGRSTDPITIPSRIWITLMGIWERLGISTPALTCPGSHSICPPTTCRTARITSRCCTMRAWWLVAHLIFCFDNCLSCYLLCILIERPSSTSASLLRTATSTSWLVALMDATSSCPCSRTAT